MDFTRHNEEVNQVWDAYQAGKPLRVPMVLTSVQRIWVLDPTLNRRGITWELYLNHPKTMLEVSLAHRFHVAHHIPQDAEMGIPANGWDIGLEFGNVYEEAWFGCEIVYPENQIATTRPFCDGDGKEKVFEKGIPGSFSGFMGHIRETYEQVLDLARQADFHGKPVRVYLPVPAATDGPLTVANGIRGVQIYEDMFADEGYYHRLMDFLTTAIIHRIRDWRAYLGHEIKPVRGGFADDAVQFLSLKTYREKVLPYHRKLMDELFGPGPHSIHLCGNVQRHFPTLITELNIRSFDTGFPIDFGSLRDQVGEDVEIQGGVPVNELIAGPPEAVYRRTKEILQSGIMRGGRFILKEANDLAPGTPAACMQAMYDAVHDFGVYSETVEA